ncbi:MAG: hypothetical protein WA020_00535 [Candidatus Acidiferrales bacterium]
MKSFPRFTPLFLLVLFVPCVALAQVESTSVDLSARTSTIGVPLSLKSSSVVTGSPVSYEQVSENSRVLADGTRITPKTTTTSFYRDSAGRTRTERPLPGGFVPSQSAPSLRLIEIRDPVAGVQYVLDAEHHVAYRLPFSVLTPQESSSEEASTALSPQVKSASAAPDDPDRPQHTSESLGTEVMEGVSVQGHRTTTVYPTGSLNNDRPITRTCENWYSADLNMPVLYKCSDLLNGDYTTRLTNINRAEPDPSLFQVPPDYQIVDGPSDGHVTMKFQLPQR